MRCILLAFALALLLTGCTEDQVRQAQAAALQARQAVAAAETALHAARQLAELTRSEQARTAVIQAEQGLSVARAAAERAEAATQAAAEAQAAGAGSLETLLAAAAAAGLPIAGWLSAWLRSRRLGNAFTQTVAGLEQARANLGEDAWKTSAAPALSTAQDETVRAMVEAVQARLKRI